MRLVKAASLAFLCTLSPSISRAAIVTSIPSGAVYDFVIVGGGNAGNAVANRLSENPNFKVLVIEAGGTEEGVIASTVPLLGITLTPNTTYDWNYTTTPQPGLGGRSTFYIRGHMLGGCSSVNYMVYTRGPAEDYDAYARFTGDLGWSWKALQPYFQKNEKWTAPADGHNTTGQYNPIYHGTTGITSVSLSGFPTPIDGRVIDSTTQLGPNFKFNLDMNSGSPLGIGWVQVSVDDTSRSSSATSYLGPQFLARPNLDVLLNTQVSRLLKTGTDASSKLPAFRAVEFLTNGGVLQNVTASKEVILSAGSIGTPHILLNSGIGNATSLKAFNIPSLVNLPDVGQNLNDHSFLASPFSVNSTNTYDTLIRNTTLQTEDFNQWVTTGTGPFVDTLTSHLGFFRLPKNASIFSTTPDPTAGRPDSPHYEFFISNGFAFPGVPAGGNYMSIATIVTSPTSRGSITLQSNNPFDPPLIDPALLKTEFDKFAMREAVKTAQKFVTAPAWSGYVIEQAGIFAGVKTDAQIDQYVAANAGSIFHATGTAMMTPKNSSKGVTNPDLTVKKVAGVRVVDASIFPFVPGSHMQAPVYVVAERASDLIKASYSG